MVEHNPLLSIGVLAHNERLNIEETLQSLFTQDVFQKFSTELVIVANGCTDETAILARRSVADHHAVWSNRGSARVEELVVAGKANAWNEFVHKLSSPLASFLILMDADITFLNTHTISSIVTSLERSPQAMVSVDRPVKDIELSNRLSFFQRLLVLATTPKFDSDHIPLCGQLYCIRSAQARMITLPVEIPVEDGFLRALLVTDGFTKPDNPRRIIFDSSVAHRFAAVATIKELFKHEKWLVSAGIISLLLYQRFWRECTADRSAMTLMKDWQEHDPEWLPRYIKSQTEEKGWRLVPRSWWTRRWSDLGKLSAWRRLQRFPVAVIASATDMLIFIAAIRDVRRGRAFRYWGRGQN